MDNPKQLRPYLVRRQPSDDASEQLANLRELEAALQEALAVGHSPAAFARFQELLDEVRARMREISASRHVREKGEGPL